MAKNVPPEPPYRWVPLGTRSVSLPEPGQLIAWRHAAWRVTEVTRWPEADWPEGLRGRIDNARAMLAKPDPGGPIRRRFDPDDLIPRHVWIRPAGFTSNGDPVRDRSATISLSAQSSFRAWDVYPSDHYPACAQCREPCPCRAEMARTLGESAEKDAAKYEITGVCPSCQEIPTPRHKVITFAENLRVPLGPPVTFHVGRRECRYDAVRYEQQIARADPGYQLVLSCPGTRTRHVYGFLDEPSCSEGDVCRGLRIPHAAEDQCARGCERCDEARRERAAAAIARNAAGDWTTW